MNYGGRLKRLAIAGAVGSLHENKVCKMAYKSHKMVRYVSLERQSNVDEWTGADAYLKNLSHTCAPLKALLVLTPRQYRNFIELFSNLTSHQEAVQLSQGPPTGMIEIAHSLVVPKERVEVGFFQSAILVSGTVLLGAVLAKLVFVSVRFVFLL
jgi:hypothetical protein